MDCQGRMRGDERFTQWCREYACFLIWMTTILRQTLTILLKDYCRSTEVEVTSTMRLTKSKTSYFVDGLSAWLVPRLQLCSPKIKKSVERADWFQKAGRPQLLHTSIEHQSALPCESATQLQRSESALRSKIRLMPRTEDTGYLRILDWDLGMPHSECNISRCT